jgi:hypothetical protein
MSSAIREALTDSIAAFILFGLALDQGERTVREPADS